MNGFSSVDTGASRNPARILLHSQRNPFSNFHYRAGLYEFENVVRQIDAVDLLSPEPRPWFEYGSRLALRLAASCRTTINPGIRRVRVQKDYDLFFAVAQFPKDLLHVKYVDGWKDRCRVSICWLNEIWIPDIARTEYFLKLLSQFDYVVLQQAGSVAPVHEIIRKPCLYMPSGIDAVEFSPYPNPPRRVIDVYSIGRRATDTHHTLLRMAREGRIFYVYDTIDGEQVLDPAEHRLQYADRAKRSRYFIVNPGKADKPHETGGQVEFGNRFFEGAAAGTIMIGETPANHEFAKVFNWPDAVVHLPFGSGSIDTIINELDNDPEKQERIRTNNVVHSLLQHDWVYRWESVLKLAGLDPAVGLLKRKQFLKNLSAAVVNEAAAS